ncbi:hydrogen gas-evolving membrane-bound hydrogenase subunit E, partial [Nocardioides sp.]|uniref:hydrogen gas-evolving membrane-bound hydrogenase subunit E n=1 Tax=Nocardioides sp. TaxID=35761 RepID=UPI002735FF47
RHPPPQVAVAVLAVTLGAATGLATWLLSGRRGLSDPAEYYLAEGSEVTGGANLVNVILVEFRALDTLGELTVLGLAGLAIVAVLTTIPSRTLDPPRRSKELQLRPLRTLTDPTAHAALIDAQANLRPLQLVLRVLVPGLVVLSMIIFWRGHNAPGGGFIAALVAAAAVALIYLSRPQDRAVGPAALHTGLISGGVLTALVTGLLGYLDSSFLEPLYGYLAGVKLSSSLLFDVGVYAAVLGMVMAAFDQLGTSRDATTQEPQPAERRTPDHDREGVRS